MREANSEGDVWWEMKRQEVCVVVGQVENLSYHQLLMHWSLDVLRQFAEHEPADEL